MLIGNRFGAMAASTSCHTAVVAAPVFRCLYPVLLERTPRVPSSRNMHLAVQHVNRHSFAPHPVALTTPSVVGALPRTATPDRYNPKLRSATASACAGAGSL